MTVKYDDAAGLAIRELMRVDIAFDVDYRKAGLDDGSPMGVQGLNGIDYYKLPMGLKNVTVTSNGSAPSYAHKPHGATQNRLENTVSNLQIQAENLQAAESRISDADVTTEMTDFVRNQVLVSSATAMLAQANSIPHVLLSLLQ